jgi:hypothetical protein
MGSGPRQSDPEEPDSPEPDTRTTRRAIAVLGELLLATLFSMAAAIGMGWQVLRAPAKALPGDGADPFIEIWSLAWSGHALHPGSGVRLAQLFDGNAFYPADYSLAFTDSLLGYGPITWLFHGTAGLVIAYNLLFVFTPALAGLGGYALARQLGAHPVGAAVAAASFAYAPWHIGQFSHEHVLSTGPLAISLAMLARGHGLNMAGRRPPIRPFWALLGWLVGAWQLTIGFANGLPFAYLLAVIGVLVLLIAPARLIRARRRSADDQADGEEGDQDGDQDGARWPPRLGWLAAADVAGGAIFAVIGGLMAYPYLRVQAIDPEAVEAARGLRAVNRFSPSPLGLLRPPAMEGTWSWLTAGHTLIPGTNETRMLPGAILLVLAVVGLFVSTWRWWWRLVLAATALGIAAFAVGTRFPHALLFGHSTPFVLLWRHAPGWASDRTPGRLMVFVGLALAMLAAGAVSRLAGWGAFGARGRSIAARTAVLALLPVLVALEGWAKVPLIDVPRMPAAVAAANGPMVVLPSIWTSESRVMYWTATRGFPTLANGQSGIRPSTLVEMRTQMKGFPDKRSVAYLRVNGFHSVAVLRAPWQDSKMWVHADRVPDPALGLTRTDLGDSVLFTVQPLGSTH